METVYAILSVVAFTIILIVIVWRQGAKNCAKDKAKHDADIIRIKRKYESVNRRKI